MKLKIFFDVCHFFFNVFAFVQRERALTWIFYSKRTLTRMHSSRMRTAHSSSCQGGSVSVHAGIDPPCVGQIPPTSPLGMGLETPLNFPPLGVGLETSPPGQIPLNFPLGCGPGDPPPGQIPLNFPLGCGPGDPPPGQISLNSLDVGLETCMACWDTTPPLGDLLQCMLGYHPVNRILDTRF